MDDRQAFLAEIEKAPWDDEAPRSIFADWLDEHGEIEEADRQRKYVQALRVLARYADTDWKYRQPGYKEEYIKENSQEDWDEYGAKLEPYKLKELMGTVEWWKEGVTGKSRYGSGEPWIGFGSNFAQDELHNPENRREFWEAFEVVTGILAPEDLQNQNSYSCAC